MAKKDFMHFVNYVQWHCTIWIRTTRLMEDIDRAVRGIFDIRTECTKMQSQNSNFYCDIGVGRLTVLTN